MSEDPTEIRDGFGRLALPEAPERLHRRLAELAAAPMAAVPRFRLWTVGSGIAAVAVLAILGLAVLGAGVKPSPSPSGGLARYDTGEFSFNYPASWRTFDYHVDSSFSHTIVYLATVDVPVPCETTVTSETTTVDCQDRWTLAPDTLVVAVTANAWLSFNVSNPPSGAAAMVIGGMPGYFEKGTSPTGDPTLTWTFVGPTSGPHNYFTISATYRGPDSGAIFNQLDALVASVTFDGYASATGTPTPAEATPATGISAWYGDGLPETIDGEHVYRASEVASLDPTHAYLVAAWDQGPLASSCPFQAAGATPHCPSFEALSDTEHGPEVAVASWAVPYLATPAMVLRVQLVPTPTCWSSPPGGCPTVPEIEVLDVVWGGTAAAPSPAPLPNPGGTCSASQITLGKATWGFDFGTVGTTTVYGTQPLRNTGGSCTLVLPTTIGVAGGTGLFQPVSVVQGGTTAASGHGTPEVSYRLPAGGSVSIGIGASWWTGIQPAGGTPVPAPACLSPVADVTRIEYPLASGALELDLPIVLKQVCSSPASMSSYFVLN